MAAQLSRADQDDGKTSTLARFSRSGAGWNLTGFGAITALVALVTVCLHFAVASTSAPGSVLYLYILVVPVAAIFWSLRHSLYAVALSLAMAEIWVLPPPSRFHLDLEHGVRATIFIVVAVTQSMVSSRLVETRRQLRSQYEIERRVAETFQKALLPRLATIPGYDNAFLYEPALQAADVGGDFLDVFYADDHTVALLLGDVTGHGLDAAVQTAELRYVIRSCVLAGDGPEQSLRGVNRAVCRDDQFPNFATVFVALLNLETNVLRYASAGHEPAILCGPCGQVTRLWTPGTPVGILEEPFGTGEQSVRIDPGASLVIYTDGITEARRGSSFFGTERIEDLVRRLAGCPVRIAVRELFNAAVTFGGGPLHDDAAVLWIRRPEGPDGEATAEAPSRHERAAPSSDGAVRPWSARDSGGQPESVRIAAPPRA